MITTTTTRLRLWLRDLVGWCFPLSDVLDEVEEVPAQWPVPPSSPHPFPQWVRDFQDLQVQQHGLEVFGMTYKQAVQYAGGGLEGSGSRWSTSDDVEPEIVIDGFRIDPNSELGRKIREAVTGSKVTP